MKANVAAALLNDIALAKQARQQGPMNGSSLSAIA
jgi:hypothetical protein